MREKERAKADAASKRRDRAERRRADGQYLETTSQLLLTAAQIQNYQTRMATRKKTPLRRKRRLVRALSPIPKNLQLPHLQISPLLNQLPLRPNVLHRDHVEKEHVVVDRLL
jgi:hypothetical protein